MGGREIVLAAWWEYHMNDAVPSGEPDPDDPMYAIRRIQYDNMRRVEREFNVTFSHLVTGDYGGHREAFLAYQVAGNPIADIVLAPGSLLIPALAGGFAHNLMTLSAPGVTFDLHSNQNFVRPAGVVGDSVYTISGNVPRGMGPTLAVNMDLVNALGLPNPITLYENGQWTWAAFMDIMRTAKAQGYFGISGTQGDVLRSLIGSNDGILVDSNFNFAATHPNTIQAFAQIHEMFNEGLWRYDTTDPESPFGDWAFQQHGFVQGADSIFFIEPSWVLNQNSAPFVFAMMPFPLGPANRSGNTHVTGVEDGAMIPIGVANPEHILILIEELQSWAMGNEWMLMEAVEEGLRGRLYTEDDVQRALYVANHTRAIDIGWSIQGGLGWMIYGVMWNLYFGNGDAAELLEAERPERQALLDDLFRN
jgi:hypothetical protein